MFHAFRIASRWIGDQFNRIPVLPRNILVTILLLCVAYLVSGILITHTGGENNSALVFVLVVVLISLLTTGYFYGIAASLVGTFCINYYFMFPFSAFSLSQAGYPVAMLSMLAISCVVCTLTARVKLQTLDAIRREKNTRSLYELNEKLNVEKSAIQLESAREVIRGNILRAVSHDLRTPLTAISGTASVLLSSPDTPEGNVPMLADIKSDADALIILVENLLSVTRIQEGTIPLKKREELLEEVAGDAILTTRRRFPDTKIDLDLSDELLFLPMEPILSKQVMVNLLENAIRHAGNREHIALHLFRQDEWAVVEVRDRGKGLSAEICMAVQTGRPLNRDGDTTRGMGIGLSVCQSIIKAHDGFFAAGNNPEGGAVFRFGLPMEEFPNE